jgi:hypothetical protein
VSLKLNVNAYASSVGICANADINRQCLVEPEGAPVDVVANCEVKLMMGSRYRRNGAKQQDCQQNEQKHSGTVSEKHVCYLPTVVTIRHSVLHGYKQLYLPGTRYDVNKAINPTRSAVAPSCYAKTVLQVY